MIRNTLVATLAVALMSLTNAASAQEKKDIVETAVAAGQFKTLAAALTAADLIPVLKGPGPFTVFAPTDDAFAKLPAGTVEALLKDKAKLTAILTYHVVPGKVLAADVVKLSSAKSVQGSPITITVKDGKVLVNQANVVKTDIMTSNGVIHVIDAVILPPTASSQAAPTETTPTHPAPSAETAHVTTVAPCQTAAPVVHQPTAARFFRLRNR